jgi:DNA-directed RNA polymerase
VKRVRDDNAEILNGTDDRKIVKQPTQTYFYGAHPKKMSEQIQEALEELGREAGPENIKKLASAIFKTCGNLAPAARQVRKFIGRLAKLYAEDGQVLCWQTKLGFPVVNEYHEPNIKPGIAVKLGWTTRLQMNLIKGDLDDLAPGKCQRSSTANLIHSFDAAHLHDVVWTAKVWGIRMATVHDCFACLAPRAEKLNHIIRSSFISIHGLSFLLLRDMRETAARDLPHMELPELPVNNGPHLNLSEVMSSRGWT